MMVPENTRIKLTKPQEVVNYYTKNAKLWAFYKPKECICDRVDRLGRTTIYDLLGQSRGLDLTAISACGRLDFNSEGLMLLTDNPLLE
jgi:16S rRNA U516 pseudouridylate synthase RsuA-like enzyme